VSTKDKETKQTHISARIYSDLYVMPVVVNHLKNEDFFVRDPTILLSLSVARTNVTENYYEFGNTFRLINFSLITAVSTLICKTSTMHVNDIIYSVY
jgi:hypothetical protein